MPKKASAPSWKSASPAGPGNRQALALRCPHLFRGASSLVAGSVRLPAIVVLRFAHDDAQITRFARPLSAALEFCFALFQECLDGFLMVLSKASERLPVGLAFEQAAGV